MGEFFLVCLLSLSLQTASALSIQNLTFRVSFVRLLPVASTSPVPSSTRTQPTGTSWRRRAARACVQVKRERVERVWRLIGWEGARRRLSLPSSLISHPLTYLAQRELHVGLIAGGPGWAHWRATAEPSQHKGGARRGER